MERQSQKKIVEVLLTASAVATMLNSCSDSPPTASVEPPKPRQKRSRNDLNEMILATTDTSLRDATKKYMAKGASSNNWQDYKAAADKALKDNDYDAATFLLDEAVRLAPNNGELYNIRGRARTNSYRGNDEAALEDLLKAKSLGALNEGGYLYMARLYDGQHETDKAIETLSEGIKKYKNRELVMARAALYVAKGEKAKAEADYGQAIKLGTDTAVYLLRAQLYESENKFELALKDYDAATKLTKVGEIVEKHSVAHKSRAILLAKLGRHQQAIDAINKLDERDNDEEAMRFRGDQYAAMKQYEKAIAEYTKSIDSSPEFARTAYEARSKVYEAIGKPDLAEADKLAAKKLQDAPAEKTLYSAK